MTILEKLADFGLLAELWPILLGMARLVAGFRRSDLSPAAMFRFETELSSLLREMGRRIVQGTVNHLEPDDRQAWPPLVKWQGEYYRRRGKSPLRNLNCLFGPIALRRCCYQPLEACGRCLFPLQVQLGIVVGVATPALADAVALGGIVHIFLTHRDDVADAQRYAEHFGSRRIIHRDELSSQPGAEVILEGNEPSELAPGFLAIPTPGHTRGHCVLLFNERFLFTGDHLAWDRDAQHLAAFENYCWYSWPKQAESIERLAAYRFEWVLPGHGQRVQLPAADMRDAHWGTPSAMSKIQTAIWWHGRQAPA